MKMSNNALSNNHMDDNSKTRITKRFLIFLRNYNAELQHMIPDCNSRKNHNLKKQRYPQDKINLHKNETSHFELYDTKF